MMLPRHLEALLNLPTATFSEDAVLGYLRATCAKLPGVKLTADRYGNLLAHYSEAAPPRSKQVSTRAKANRTTEAARGRRRTSTAPPLPLAFVAHTDHPGFVCRAMRDAKTAIAEFRGGVRAEYFAGRRVRFWLDGQWVPGEVIEPLELGKSVAPNRPAMPKAAIIRVQRPIPPNTLAMWDLPDATLEGDTLAARPVDDIAGVAAMLTLLERLSRRRVAAEAYCLFTRAEEIGFIGALGAIRARTLPKRAAVISVEMSSASAAGAVIGGGPVMRIGDRGTVFSPALCAFCNRVAGELVTRDAKKTQKRAAARRSATQATLPRPLPAKEGSAVPSFQYQRKLMDGGMCEASAFGAYGYQVAGLCLALGNYHNMDTTRQEIASEHVSLRDWAMLVDLFEALVRDPVGPTREDAPLRKRLDDLFAEHAGGLV